MSRPKFENLTLVLPRFINLGGLEEIIEDVKGTEQSHDLLPLTSALCRAGVIPAYASQNHLTMINNDHWDAWCRDEAEENLLIDGETNPLSNFVRWSDWADAVMIDFTEVVVEEGTFEGVWQVRV